uniref:Putative secreted protein n=1 Tax=Ixodes ricinus TaxID=34613 RepID=A0A147BDI6_IXORI
MLMYVHKTQLYSRPHPTLLLFLSLSFLTHGTAPSLRSLPSPLRPCRPPLFRNTCDHRENALPCLPFPPPSPNPSGSRRCEIPTRSLCVHLQHMQHLTQSFHQTTDLLTHVSYINPLESKEPITIIVPKANLFQLTFPQCSSYCCRSQRTLCIRSLFFFLSITNDLADSRAYSIL